MLESRRRAPVGPFGVDRSRAGSVRRTGYVLKRCTGELRFLRDKLLLEAYSGKNKARRITGWDSNKMLRKTNSKSRRPSQRWAKRLA